MAAIYITILDRPTCFWPSINKKDSKDASMISQDSEQRPCKYYLLDILFYGILLASRHLYVKYLIYLKIYRMMKSYNKKTFLKWGVARV